MWLAGHTCCVSEQAPDGLIPESLVERGDLWTIAVNRNQDLLGKTMIVLNRACEAVTDLEQQSGSTCTGRSAGLSRCSMRSSILTSTTLPSS